MNTTPADYAVIRFVPDLARHEVFNLGLVAWNAAGRVLSFDAEATKRILRQNPHLASEYFRFLEIELRRRLDSIQSSNADSILSAVRSGAPPQMSVSDPRLFAVPGNSHDDLSARVDDLMRRVVTPRKTGGRSSEATPLDELGNALRAWIINKRVQPAYPVRGHTGVQRTIDFFSNSSANVALDALRLDVKRAGEVISRADREANKIRDVLAAGEVRRYVVYCRLSPEPELSRINDGARSIIKDAGAMVGTSVEEAVHLMERFLPA